MYVHIPERVHGCWVNNRGWEWYSGPIEIPSGQNETHLGNLYEKWQKCSRMGKKFNHKSCNVLLTKLKRPTNYNSISKICPNFQNLTSHFFEVDDLSIEQKQCKEKIFLLQSMSDAIICR